MKRLAAICDHVLAVAPASAAAPDGRGSTGGARVAGAMPGPSRPEAKDLRRMYGLMQEALEERGELPDWTIFDMNVATDFHFVVPSRGFLRKLLEEAEAAGRLEQAKLLPGPLQDCASREQQIDLLEEVIKADAEGRQIYYYAELQRKYGGQGLASNIAVPAYVQGRWGKHATRELHVRFLINHPDDSEIISRRHVRKDQNFEPIVYDSIISTTDVQNWRAQRGHYAEAFLPLSSLARVLPTSLARAKECAARLKCSCDEPVDMSDFFLHEALAQLQLALLGASEERMQRTNKPARLAFAGDSRAEPGLLGAAVKEMMLDAKQDAGLTLPSDVAEEGDRPYKGPVAKALATSEFTASSTYGTAVLVLFAGHDTTGHTMTWLTYELARHPEIQREVQREVDEFFSMLGGRDPAYEDLQHLQFLSRCITETLRLWPAVANGTFRQLHFPDVVTGPSGDKVTLPAGARCQVLNWSRHRNPDLWGSDADEFNPWRDFRPGELVAVGCPLAAANPQSERFSPFAYGPRNCLGRNFAQMEMRLIMAYLLRDLDFALAGAWATAAAAGEEVRGVNRGTMGPMDLERAEQKAWGVRHLVGLKLRATPRAAR